MIECSAIEDTNGQLHYLYGQLYGQTRRGVAQESRILSGDKVNEIDQLVLTELV